MNTTWKPQTKKPNDSSQKSREAQASTSACRAVALPAADAAPSRDSTMPRAAGSISRMAAPSASSALCQPNAVIRYSDAGSRANWPKLPAAPAMPSAWLRWFGE